MTDQYPFISTGKICGDLRFDMWITNEVAQNWYGWQRLELPEFLWLRDQIDPGFTIIDCGAHHGLLTTIMALTANTGHVTAYEVLPDNARVIEQNAVLNHLSNVTVRPVGIGAEAGQFNFDVQNSNCIVKERATAVEGIEIVRLDDDYGDGPVDLVKIDVEGSELLALDGAQRVLSKRPIVDLELHNFLATDRRRHTEMAVGAFARLGYVWQVIGEVHDRPSEPTEYLDTVRLSLLDNPHILGIPKGRIFER